MANPSFLILNTHLDIVDNSEKWVTTFIKTSYINKLNTVIAVRVLVFYCKQGNASKTDYFLPFSRYSDSCRMFLAPVIIHLYENVKIILCLQRGLLFALFEDLFCTTTNVLNHLYSYESY